MVLNIKDGELDEILENNSIVVVDFWAPWCGPCKMIEPTFEELANTNSDDIKICKVNVDENMELAKKYLIRSIPTIIFFRNGISEKKLTGLVSKDILQKNIDALKS